jgi:hypothetical protein
MGLVEPNVAGNQVAKGAGGGRWGRGGKCPGMICDPGTLAKVRFADLQAMAAW